MINLMHHQQVALNYMRFNDSFALFMEQGVGKTLPTLFRILELYKQSKIKNCLVVAPIVVIGSWQSDIELFDKEDQVLLNSCITTINYERVWQRVKGKDKLKPREEIDKIWDCIVLDEAHNIKNRTSNRSQVLFELSLNAKYRYILTGTPISNGQLENLWSQYTFLAPRKTSHGKVESIIFNGSYTKFLDRYCYLNRYYQPYKYHNVKEFQSIMNEYSYRVEKKDCLDLPDKLPDILYRIPLAEPTLYKTLLKESCLPDYQIICENALSTKLRLRQFLSGNINGKKIKCNKISTLKEFLDDFDKKLVIFAQFTESIHDIEELLKKMKLKHITMNGEQKDKLAWKKFNTDETIKVIVIQYQSGNAGVNLQVADTIIYYEPTDRSIFLEQSRDRIHRKGQKNPCTFIHFVTEKTIEVDMYRTVSNYQDFTDKLFNQIVLKYQKGRFK